MRLLRVAPFILAGFAVACSSATSSTPTTAVRPATQTVRTAAAGSFIISNSNSADVSTLPFSADAVWRILPSVFDSVGIPLGTVDVAQKRIGNEGFKIRSRLGKSPLSRFLDCGNTQIGPNADSYDVVLTVITVVQSSGTSESTLTTTVDAQARPVTYNQAYSRCTSKNSLEIRIADIVKARLTP